MNTHPQLCLKTHVLVFIHVFILENFLNISNCIIECADAQHRGAQACGRKGVRRDGTRGVKLWWLYRGTAADPVKNV